MSLALFAFCAGGCDDPLPELTTVPAFALVSHTGDAYGSADLHGHVWVANFVFTTCPSVCPMLTTQMGNVQRRVGDAGDAEPDVRFVSFTVDPEHDTPEVLARYAELHSADTSNWTFLTGEPGLVRQTISGGLRMGVGERTDEGDITHAMHFVLVDRTMTIRGFYRTDAESLEALENDIRRLL